MAFLYCASRHAVSRAYNKTHKISSAERRERDCSVSARYRQMTYKSRKRGNAVRYQ